MTTEPTAREQYETHRDAIMALLESISSDVAMHNVAFDRHWSRSWAYVGDLAHIHDLLEQVDNFLNNKE